jgi:predicted GIY-YIG superfamily endonuclease
MVFFYVGQTNNLEKRISEHSMQTFSGYTSSRLPVRLVYHHAFTTRSEALSVERRLKKWSHSKKQALIEGMFSL